MVKAMQASELRQFASTLRKMYPSGNISKKELKALIADKWGASTSIIRDRINVMIVLDLIEDRQNYYNINGGKDAVADPLPELQEHEDV